MAEEMTNPAQAVPAQAVPLQAVPAPAASSPARKGSPLLVFLTVLLILVGIADVILWGLAGYYWLRSVQSGTPAQLVSTDGTSPAAGTPASGGDASGDAEKQEALRAYIQELADIVPLETELLESYASVSGTNYTDDATMYAEITERTLPLCQQMNEKVLKISSNDPEIGEFCEMHRDYATKLLNALNMLISAINSQDPSQVAEANEQFNAASDLAADYQRSLRSLAAERGVSLDI